MRALLTFVVLLGCLEQRALSASASGTGSPPLSPVAAVNQIGQRVEKFQARNILVVAMAGSRSHAQFYGRITEVLADRGHNVTLISPYAPKLRDNLHHIMVDGDIAKILNNSMDLATITNMFSIMNKFTDCCVQSMKEPELRALDIEQFDSILSGIMVSDCFVYRLANSKVPLISFVPNTITSVVHSVMGTMEFPSVTSDIWAATVPPMGFLQRMGNIAAGYFQVWLYKYHTMAYTNQQLCAEGLWCPGDGGVSSVFEFNQRSSLVFINTLESLQKPTRPLPLNVVPVGGLNCRAPAPLPQSLKEWADDAKEGFIYFSLGSALRISDLEPEVLSNITESFRALKLKVLWKSNTPAPENTPPNVRMEKWLPQQDVLGHPNCVLFISHGGLFSATEATYHAVPMLLLPVFGDQPGNAQRIVTEGWGKMLDLSTLSASKLTKTVRLLIEDPKYKNVVEERSTLMKDQPLAAEDLVVYWTEYVMRHDGAPHLRSPFYDYYWFQIYNLDVWLFIIAVTVLVLALVLKIFVWSARTCFRCCFSSRWKQPVKSKKPLKKE